MHPSTTEFLEAVKNGSSERASALLDQDPGLVQARDEDGTSAILLAMYYGHPDIAGILIEKGAVLDIFEAAATGSLERVAQLVSTQPDLVNAYARDGFQPLGLASFFGHFDVVRFLLEMGAGVNSPSDNPLRVMPLHSAVAHQHLPIAQILLAHGAAVNARQAGYFTPLHGAVQNGQAEMVELLLSNGANPQARSVDGKLPLDIAQEKGYDEISSMLKRHSSD